MGFFEWPRRCAGCAMSGDPEGSKDFLGLGYVEGVTHDHVRHGTTTLFAELNVSNGAILAECKSRSAHLVRNPRYGWRALAVT